MSFVWVQVESVDKTTDDKKMRVVEVGTRSTAQGLGWRRYVHAEVAFEPRPAVVRLQPTLVLTPIKLLRQQIIYR